VPEVGRTFAIAALLAAACGSGDAGAPPPPAGNSVGEPCARTGECRSGLVCFSGACAADLPATGSCPAPPRTAAIAAGAEPNAIEPAPEFCVSAAVGTVLPAEMVHDLGVLEVGSDASFTVAPGTSSFVIFSQEVDGSRPDSVSITGVGEAPNSVVPARVRDPDGAVYYDDLADWPTIPGTRYPDVSSLLAFDPGFQAVSRAFPVPNTSPALDRIVSAGEVQPGTWSFTVNDWARECPFGDACLDGDGSGRYRVHAVTRPGPLASTGTLDVEVYLATDPTSVLSTAAGAAAHPQTERWVRSLGRYLANAGLCLGTVTFHDLPRWVKDRYAASGTVDVTDSSPCGDVQQLFTTATVPARAAHLFLADEVTAGDGTDQFSVVGMTGSIPGPSGFPGTIYGGTIVGLFDEFGAGSCGGSGPSFACGTDRLAYVTAHEIGHWLGLFHTTEMGGEFFDPVSDTARCPCSSCGTGCDTANALVTPARCSAAATCGGTQNLMFWAFDPARSAGEVSRDQAQIVRLNPAVR
jgi:hypothetical protein